VGRRGRGLTTKARRHEVKSRKGKMQRLRAAAEFGIENMKGFVFAFKDPESKLDYTVDSGKVLEGFKKAVGSAEKMGTAQGVKEMDEKARGGVWRGLGGGGSRG
jgi:hypothetical protein